MFELAPNTKLKNGKYEIERLHKSGTQTLVYFATNLEDSSSRVVIKQGEPDNFSESDILNSLSHPSLPKVVEPFQERFDGVLYNFLVLDAIEGQTLREAMHKNDIPYAQVISWANQLLDILIYLQTSERHVIHKDINPNNIMVDESDKIYLIDFGISKDIDSKDELIGGTDSYMSPEHSDARGITDFRSDLYSFSATLYHLLAQKKPETAAKRIEALVNGLPDPLTKASDLYEHIPYSISELIARGMSLKHNERPAHAQEMQALFQQAEYLAFLESSDVVTKTSATKLQSSHDRFEISVPSSGSRKFVWGIGSIKPKSEASYNLYFIEDAVRTDKYDREVIKDRFISVVGRSRIDSNRDLALLLGILKSLCKRYEPDEEANLLKEIKSYRKQMQMETVTGTSKMSLDERREIFRKRRRLFFAGCAVGLLLILGFLFWLFLSSSNSTPITKTIDTTPSPVPATLVGKRGKVVDTANLRAEASQDSLQIGTLSTNTEVEVLATELNDKKGKSTVWCKVKVLSHDDSNSVNEGWISSRFLKDLQ